MDIDINVAWCILFNQVRYLMNGSTQCQYFDYVWIHWTRPRFPYCSDIYCKVSHKEIRVSGSSSFLIMEAYFMMIISDAQIWSKNIASTIYFWFSWLIESLACKVWGDTEFLDHICMCLVEECHTQHRLGKE